MTAPAINAPTSPDAVHRSFETVARDMRSQRSATRVHNDLLNAMNALCSLTKAINAGGTAEEIEVLRQMQAQAERTADAARLYCSRVESNALLSILGEDDDDDAETDDSGGRVYINHARERELMD